MNLRRKFRNLYPIGTEVTARKHIGWADGLIGHIIKHNPSTRPDKQYQVYFTKHIRENLTCAYYGYFDHKEIKPYESKETLKENSKEDST